MRVLRAAVMVLFIATVALVSSPTAALPMLPSSLPSTSASPSPSPSPSPAPAPTPAPAPPGSDDEATGTRATDVSLPPQSLAAGGAPTSWAGFAKGMFVNAALGIGNKAIGLAVNAAFDMIFGPDKTMADYFAEMLVEMRNIVKEELAEKTRDDISKFFSNTVEYMQISYKSRKEQVGTWHADARRELHDDVKDFTKHYVMSDTGTMHTLKAAGNVGFGAYLVGAGLHLDLLQEAAAVDPLNYNIVGQWRHPQWSSHAKECSEYAQLYFEYASSAWQRMQTTDPHGRYWVQEFQPPQGDRRCALRDMWTKEVIIHDGFKDECSRRRGKLVAEMIDNVYAAYPKAEIDEALEALRVLADSPTCQLDALPELAHQDGGDGTGVVV